MTVTRVRLALVLVVFAMLSTDMDITYVIPVFFVLPWLDE